MSRDCLREADEIDNGAMGTQTEGCVGMLGPLLPQLGFELPWALTLFSLIPSLNTSLSCAPARFLLFRLMLPAEVGCHSLVVVT